MESYSIEKYEALRRDIHSKIERKLSSLGLFFRIFSRIKSQSSLLAKLGKKGAGYAKSGTKLQDFLGVRVTVYFEEDIQIVDGVLRGIFKFSSDSIDSPSANVFSPKRYNLVFEFPDGAFLGNPEPTFVDNTFEVQIRTIFSEGWHEIEHDLRYKNSKQWDDNPIQSRGLNSIIATLEMCDWGISNLVDEMAYNAYKRRDFQSLLLNKLKLRMASYDADPVFDRLRTDQDFLKRILRADRHKLIAVLARADSPVPMHANNLLWILAKTQGICDISGEVVPAPLGDLLSSL